MHIGADVSLFFHIGADVSLFFNDGHVELEDDDHDVVDVVDVIVDVVDVISPLSFKVEMNNLMVSSVMLKDMLMVMLMTKM